MTTISITRKSLSYLFNMNASLKIDFFNSMLKISIYLLKIKSQIKQLNSFTENFYESDDCLKILNSIDKSYGDKLNRNRISEILAETNYPGKNLHIIK